MTFYTIFLIAKLARFATLDSLSSLSLAILNSLSSLSVFSGFSLSRLATPSDVSTLTAFFICTKIRHSYTHTHKRIHTLNILNVRPGGPNFLYSLWHTTWDICNCWALEKVLGPNFPEFVHPTYSFLDIL